MGLKFVCVLHLTMEVKRWNCPMFFLLAVNQSRVTRRFRSKDLQRWPHLPDLRLPPAARGDVLLLIGADVPEEFWTLEERRGKRGEPYALRAILG